MSKIFKRSLIFTIGFFLIAGVLLRFYLNQSVTVPAWLPPPICPCWNNEQFQCQAQSFCRPKTNLEPTPTPYLNTVQNTNTGSISTISLSQDCKATIGFTSNQSLIFSLPTSRAILNTSCNPDALTLINQYKTYAFIENNSNPTNASISIFILNLKKIISLENIGQIKISDAIFLPNNHLIVLINNKLRVYDLESLVTTYPANVDFGFNNFKSIAQQSTTIDLPPSSISYTTLRYESGKIYILSSEGKQLALQDESSIYPRSSCPCWDNSKNSCLPASACL